MSANSQIKSPISAVQRRKLIELARGLSGSDESRAVLQLETLFNEAFKHGMSEASYEEGAHITAKLLSEQRTGERAVKLTVSVCPECGEPAPTHTRVCSIGKSMVAPVAPSAPAASSAPIHELPESPYSWNLHAEAKDGWDEQFTVRASDAKTFIEKIEGLKKYLGERGYKPQARGGRQGVSNSAVASENETAPVCPYHKMPMEKRQGKNGSFWSCHNKIEGTDQWCSYKPK